MDRDPMVVRADDSPEFQHIIAGAHMHRRGEPQEANPHPEGTEEHYLWKSGWIRPSMYIGDEPEDEDDQT